MHTNFPFILDRPAEAEPMLPCLTPLPPATRITETDVLKGLKVTPEEAAAIAGIPQGTEAWLVARQNRITASNFGAAIGMNRYKTPRGLLRDLLWSTFKGNAATRWGNEHEDIARDAYVIRMQADILNGTSEYISLRVEETGLHINPDRPWLGSSPDGVVQVTTWDGNTHKFLLEIKCPYRKQLYDPPVPDYYNCQIQGVMANMGLPYCDFVVWTPTEMQVTRVPFDESFWTNTLLPGLYHFYHNMYLPLVVAKHNGELSHGDTEIVLKL